MDAQFDIPTEINKENIQQHVKIVVRPPIPNNHTNWQVFDSDEQILSFLLEEDVFFVSNQDKLKHHYDNQIIRLKSNKLPKGLVTLESIFNRDDEFRRNKAGMQVKEDHYEDLEVVDGKFLKLGKVCI